MERLLRLFLSVAALSFLLGCQKTAEERAEEASKFGFNFYQGTPQHMNAFAYAIELDSTNAKNWRELSVTYLKRGIPHEWKKYYDKAVIYDAKVWQPWRGYLYLWFYRDYKKAIADFNASDTLTPNFIDAPQGHSVDYWRGIAYLGLNDYKNSIAYFSKNIDTETEEYGEDWIEPKAFLFRGIAYYENGTFDKALVDFDKFIFYNKDKTADGKYYKALIYREQNKCDEAKRLVLAAIKDFKAGYSNSRPYVETMRQIYMEDLTSLKTKIEKECLRKPS